MPENSRERIAQRPISDHDDWTEDLRESGIREHETKAPQESLPLTRFLEDFDPHVTPELLSIILVEVLERLEALHRHGLARKDVYGTVSPSNVRIDPSGEVFLDDPTTIGFDRRFEAPEVTCGEPADAASDVYSVAFMFYTMLLPYTGAPLVWRRRRHGLFEQLGERAHRWRRRVTESRAGIANVTSPLPVAPGARLHPKLKEILQKAMSPSPSSRYPEVWSFKAALLEFLDEMGIAGEQFFLREFMRDPVGYNHHLSKALSSRESGRIRRLARRGRRRRAIAELDFLLEIAPESREALDLLRTVKQGRRRLAANVAYASLIAALLVISASVIAIKLNLPFSLPLEKSTPQTLLIEPMTDPFETQQRAGQTGRTISGASPVIELNKSERPLTDRAARRPGYGLVRFELDSETVARLVSNAGNESTFRGGDVARPPVGTYTVIVEKPGYPVAMAEIDVSDRVIIALREETRATE